MGQYPPGSTFKTSQGLTFLSEGIVTPSTLFPCPRGFYFRGLHVGCHGHAAPINLVPAISQQLLLLGIVLYVKQQTKVQKRR